MNRNKHPLHRHIAIAMGTLALSACGGSSDGDDNAVTPNVAGDQQTAEAGPEPTFKENYSPIGAFSDPFAEPTIIVDGETVETDEKCVTNAEGLQECKPSAGTVALLNDGRILYLNALEGTENVELSIVAEFGEVSVNDQTRVLSLGDNDQPDWLKPSPLRGGANPDGQ